MRLIAPALRDELNRDAFYHSCARAGIGSHVCSGRVTWDHVIIFGGEQVNEPWAIVPLCARAHGTGFSDLPYDRDSNLNEWIALSRAPAGRLNRSLWQRYMWLRQMYGDYFMSEFEATYD